MAHYRLGSHDQAQAALRRLLNLFSGAKLAQLDRGNLFVQNEEEHLFEAAQVLSEAHQVLRSVWKAIKIKDLGKAAKLLEDLKVQLGHKSNEVYDEVQAVTKALASAYYNESKTAGCDNGLYAEPVRLMRTSLEFDPNYVPALNDLARLLATCPRPELRDGAESVKLAEEACEVTGWKDCQCIDTLAAGCAELGDYDRAVEYQERAIALLLPGVQRSFHDQSTSQRSYEMRLKKYEAAEVYHKGLVGRWTFEKTSKSGKFPDVSGSDLHGETVGDARIVEDTERAKVLRLDGNGDYVDCGNHGQFDITGEITVSAWIKVEDFDKDWQAIVVKGDSWWLKRYGDTNTVGFSYRYWDQARKGGGRFTRKLSRNVNDGKWHHVVAVRGLGHLRMYLDGNIGCTCPCNSKDITVDNGSLWIGGRFLRRPEQEWKGLIDDVRIYNYALTDAEIRDMYGSDSQKTLASVPKRQDSKNARQNALHADFTPWMNRRDYQMEFDIQVQKKHYPVKIEGRSYEGENQFRAIFEPFPLGSFDFRSCHGLTEQSYVKRNRDFLSKGYMRVFLQIFDDYKGVKRYQATWTRFRHESQK
jgi:hypothetical protein